MGIALPEEGGQASLDGSVLTVHKGIPRVQADATRAQAQTRDTFGFLWGGEGRFESPESLKLLGDWYRTLYGPVADASWWAEHGDRPLLIDAGCGAGLSALGLFGDRLRRVRYLGVDISTAVDAAAMRFRAQGLEPGFLQCSLMDLPLRPASVDLIYSQGVLHHTDSTREALLGLARLLKPGGRFLFYVYRRKGPVREFTDDLIRDRLQEMAPEDAWAAMIPLTRLGQALGELKLEIKVPEAIDLLQIPAGRIDLQRLFYWHVFKAFYRPDLTLEEMNHINFDWYAPRNAHRQSPQEVRVWCEEAGLIIEREHVEDAGIAVIARKVA
ncbi:class I SAM-dependent methyltransferase [Azospirillum agricola]|uniref:class I SAM-dependent methyltransferase n=1 Tax=Azospirillum agricola TaxID=1720247 RepID=UPI001B3BDB05|nr:class I SAM-dependent methyltransferase [Azospirillum agricola]